MRKLLSCMLLLLCAMSSLAAKHRLSVCAIFQDEAPYFEEWIEFHKLQGATHFYLYNNRSQDNYYQALDPYIKSGEVTLIDWPFTYLEGDHEGWIRVQSAAYSHCMRCYGEQNEWIAVIDIDEFLYCPGGSLVVNFLEEYTSYGGLCVNWIKFGTSYIEDILPGELLIERLTMHGHPYLKEHYFVKSIVQPKYVENCTNAHYFNYVKGKYAVDADKKRMKKGMRSKRVLLDKIMINHYWARTERYMREVKIPSRQKRRAHFTFEKQMEMLEPYNQYTSSNILQFVPRLRTSLAKRNKAFAERRG